MKTSLYSQHKEHYKDGCGSSYCSTRNKLVFAKGKLPCDVLLIGEAPGQSEDIIGIPFVGPAGKLLDAVIESSGLSKYRLAFTNLVGCMPKDVDTGLAKMEPDAKNIKICSGRLVDFINLANPSHIVCVGKLTTKYVEPLQDRFNNNIKLHHVLHPAYILRSNIAQRDILIQQTTIVLRDIYSEDEE